MFKRNIATFEEKGKCWIANYTDQKTSELYNDNVMKKYILLILIVIGLLFCFLWFNSKPICLVFNYSKHKITTDKYQKYSSVPRDTILLIFHYGFNSDLVKVVLNGKEIYHKRLKYIDGMPITSSFEFRREPENSIQIFINNQKTNQFEFDNRFDCGVITWNAETSNLTIEYDMQKEMAGFD